MFRRENQKKVSYLEYFKLRDFVWDDQKVGRIIFLVCFLREIFNATCLKCYTIYVKVINKTVRAFEIFMKLYRKENHNYLQNVDNYEHIRPYK